MQTQYACKRSRGERGGEGRVRVRIGADRASSPGRQARTPLRHRIQTLRRTTFTRAQCRTRHPPTHLLPSGGGVADDCVVRVVVTVVAMVVMPQVVHERSLAVPGLPRWHRNLGREELPRLQVLEQSAVWCPRSFARRLHGRAPRGGAGSQLRAFMERQVGYGLGHWACARSASEGVAAAAAAARGRRRWRR